MVALHRLRLVTARSYCRNYAQLAQWNHERWPDPKVKKLVASIRKQYFPRNLGRNGQPQTGREKSAAGVPLNDAIRQVVKRAQTDSAISAGTEITFEATCKLVGENANGVRGIITMAKPLNKDISILALCPEAQWEQAKAAGAKYAGGALLIQDIIEDKISFDRCIATLDQMPILAKVARILGPKGLMPNTKTGTLTSDIVGAIKLAFLTTPFKIDKESALLRLTVGSTTFSEADIKANVKVVMDYVNSQNKTTEDGDFLDSAQLLLGDKMAVQLAKNDYAQHKGPRFLTVLEKHRAQVAARPPSTAASLDGRAVVRGGAL